MRRAVLLTILGAAAGGCFLRFHRLADVPVALYCDEAFHGYEAYCLLRTGADSRGVPHPLFFDIFGVGWEEPLYVYLTMLPVGLLGTTEAAARAVAAASGTLAVPAVAALAFAAAGGRAAAAAALLMAVSPWAFHFSRVGFQASLLPLLLASGGAALLRGAAGRESASAASAPEPSPPRADVRWLLLGAVLMTSALYAYVAARLLVPLLLAGFAAAFWAPLRGLGARRACLPIAAIALLAAPVAAFALTSRGMERFQEVGLLARHGGGEAAAAFASNYLSYLSPSFLLTSGDPNLRHGVRGFGALLPHDVAFLIVGVAAALLRRRPGDLFLLWWLAAAPLPAALAADPAHAVRAIGVLPPLYALEGVGAAVLVSRGAPLDPRRPAGRVLAALAAAGCVVAAGAYLRHYFVEYPKYSAPAWQYGLKQAYREVESVAPGHDSIYVTRLEDFPHVQRLYLFAFPPVEYQTHRFGRTKYLFDEPTFYPPGVHPDRSAPIFLVKPEEVERTGAAARRVVPYPDGTPAFVIAW